MNNIKKESLYFITLSLLFVFSLSGCAGYSITKNGEGVGYDVYRPEPYLLIKPSEKSADVSIVWLPNFQHRYRISTWNFLGKADFQFNFTDGWSLTQITDKSDNTAMASTLLDVFKKATKEATISLTGDVELYRLVYNEKGEFFKLELVPLPE